jgi:predicted DNA-binding protein with PD1-like motif
MARWKRMMAGGSWLVVLEGGDEIIEAVTQFAREEEIEAGHFTGIGAVGSAELGHYDVDRQQYAWRSFAEPLEIVSLTGNVAKKGGNIVVHAHVAVGTHAMALFGGHLKKAVVSATCEIVLHEFEGELRRTHDPRTGLHLVDL